MRPQPSQGEEQLWDELALPSMHRRALISLLTAIAALLLPLTVVCFQPLVATLLQLPGGIFAIYSGLRARREVTLSMGRLTGEGVAMGGVILGIMVLLIGILTLVLGIALEVRQLD